MLLEEPSTKIGESYLNIITTQNGNVPVHDHVLRMERPEDRAMVVNYLQVDMGNFGWSRKSNVLHPVKDRSRLKLGMLHTLPVYSSSDTGW